MILKINKFILNFLSNFGFQAIVAISGLILPPLIIKNYGSEINGLLASLKQTVSYMAIVEAGIGAAAVAALYKPLSDNNILLQNRILATTKLFYNKSGCVFSILLIVISSSIFLFDLVSLDSASVILLIMGGATALDLFLIGKFRVYLVASKNNHIMMNVQSLVAAFNFALTYIFIKYNQSIYTVVGLMCVSSWLKFIFLYFYFKLNFPLIQFRIDVDVHTVEISQRWDALTHQIAGLVVYNTPIILVASMCGLKEASVYSIYAFVFSSISLFLSTLSNGTQAFFAKHIVENDLFLLNKSFSRFEQIYYFSIFIVYTTAAVLIDSFLKIYTNGLNDANYFLPLLALLFVINGVLDNLRAPGVVLIISAGHFRETKNRAIIEAAINVICSLIFIKLFGMYGAVLGSICSYIYRVLDIIQYTSTEILNEKVAFRVKLISLLTIYSIFCYLVIMHLLEFSAISFLRWFLDGVICFAVLCFAFSGLYFFCNKSIFIKNTSMYTKR